MNEVTELHLRTKKHMDDECNSLLHMLSKDPSTGSPIFRHDQENNYLQICLATTDPGCDSRYKRKEIQYLKYRFPELINTAVFHCPLVEELSLQVLHKDCLQHLRRLKRLNSLVLECTFCDDLGVDECFSLLGEIRHQLKHLVINSSNINRRFPLNVVIDNCENLETLGVLELTAINLPLRTNTRFRRLKRISIEMNLNYLGEVLRYCDNLTYLLLFGHYMINESELQVNLSNTSALKLQTRYRVSIFLKKCRENGT
ncbi:hypothetical protein CEXT_670971 [Caerostris extrusa]|uniref:Uncharacterized protein n=1 Tax=Caerostris extrusa TaxID=172846 RepID=A0AAV4U689_CAEEX|nr:hypothetical protein CEXT_670971 [Caerostris extrusa]